MLHKIDSKFFHPSINQSISFFFFIYSNCKSIMVVVYTVRCTVWFPAQQKKKWNQKKKKLFPSYNNPILAIYFYFYSKKKWHYPWIKKVKCYKLHLLLLLVLYPSFFFFLFLHSSILIVYSLSFSFFTPEIF